MQRNDYIKKVRMFLADSQGVIWDDVEINDFLDEGLKQYCIDSGEFVGRFDFYPNNNKSYDYPDDFATFMIGWNKNGTEITQCSATELIQKQNKNIYKIGDIEYIYDDLSTYGEFNLYPDISQIQNVQQINITTPYGEIFDTSYGVFINEDYGTTLSIITFDFAGDIYYHKIGNLEDVKDYMAIIYYVLSLAYNTDSDLANADTAQFWKRQYKNRINAFCRITYQNIGKQTNINFF